ncbi:MAG: carbohydrate ABC transporter permease [Acetanaerobacterium sp.]
MKKISVKTAVSAVPRYVILTVVTVVTIFPLLWVIMSSFKTNQQILSSAVSFPTSFNFSGYIAALQLSPLILYYANSLIVAIFSTLGSVLIVAMASYIIARVKFKGSKSLVMMLSSSLLIPTSALLMPIYIIMTKVGLYDTRIGLIIVYAALGLPTSLFILRGHFINVPREIEEAAFMDGCGFLRTFFVIVLPIVKSGLVTAGILQFLTSWNEFMFALILTGSNKVRTLPLALSYFTSQFSYNYTAMFAALVMVILPSILIYALLQEQVTDSIVSGSVKG